MRSRLSMIPSLLLLILSCGFTVNASPVPTPTPARPVRVVIPPKVVTPTGNTPNKINTTKPKLPDALLNIKEVKVAYDKRFVIVLIENLGGLPNKPGDAGLRIEPSVVTKYDGARPMLFWEHYDAGKNYFGTPYPAGYSARPQERKVSLPTIAPGQSAWVESDISLPDPGNYAPPDASEMKPYDTLNPCTNLTNFYASQPVLRVSLWQKNHSQEAKVQTRYQTPYTPQVFSLAVVPPGKYSKCK